jgi:dynein heavy chain
MVPPLQSSVSMIYGSILKASFTAKRGAKPDVIDLSPKLVMATVELWDKVKKSLLPTPSRFHYVFTMRELSRVFQQVMSTPLESIGNKEVLVNLWRHENTRVFADKLARMVDKDFVDKCVQEFATGHFGEDMA